MFDKVLMIGSKVRWEHRCLETVARRQFGRQMNRVHVVLLVVPLRVEIVAN